MARPTTFIDRVLVFCYKVQRKLRRELRKRFTPSLTKWDLRCLRATMQNRDARSLLLNYADVMASGWSTDASAWFSEQEMGAVVAKANEILSHRFDLLGSGPVFLGDAIDWHCDLKTGFRWPEHAHHLNIAWDAVPPGTDIKMPWELSRCQHFTSLALADMVTSDGCYYEEFKTQVRSWIASNPCGFGVNWVCAMDVAIRAVNWLTATALFRRRIEEDNDADFFATLVESLWLHGRHIMRNLEWQGPRSDTMANHFLADLCGVLAVGSLFRDYAQGKNWSGFAHRWFETEVRRQVFADGANFETSTSYHRLSYEMFLWADNMTERFGAAFSSVYQERLAGMASFVMAYTSPSGKAAQFGDNDGGRLLTVGVEDPSDHRYLASAACGFGGGANRLLLNGGRNLPKTVEREGFSDAGFWFGATSGAWLGVRAGQVSHKGAHAHADQLSFVLSIAGLDVIVDPGTGVYSADVGKRNAYRSTAAHNSPCLNGLEANHFSDGMAGLFQMTENTRTEVKAWEVSSARVYFEGCHHGFSRILAGCVCTRSLELGEGHLVVVDRISPMQEGDRIEWSLRLAPGIKAEVVPGGALLAVGNMSVRIFTTPPLECEIEDLPFSPSYGVEIPATALHLRCHARSLMCGEQRIEFRWGAI